MSKRRTEIHWCWAGLATMAWLGWMLSDARDLLSPDEQLLRIDLGTWLRTSELGIDEIAWTFRITPLSAWWSIGVAMLFAFLGWKARRSDARCPFGVLGGLLCLAAWGAVFAENLLVMLFCMSAQTWLASLWLTMRSDGGAPSRSSHQFAIVMSVGDALCLVGLILAGIAWGTLDGESLATLEFVLDGWKQRPAVCGLAGILVFLGLMARFGWLVFVLGLRGVTEISAWSLALVFGTMLWPANVWMLVRIQQILGCAPETVAVVQALSLLAAVAAAVIATAQSDLRRVVMLLASSQWGLLVSLWVVPGLVPTDWWLVAAFGVIDALIMLMLMQQSFHPLPETVLFNWWLLAGGCLSPLFVMSARAMVDLPDWQPPAITLDAALLPSEADAVVSATADSFRVRPMPVTTWTALWSAWTCFASFAAYRAWKQGETDRTLRAAIEHLVANSSSRWVLRLSSLILALTVGWSIVPMLVDVISWPSGAAVSASLLGGVVAAVICRDLGQIESRFQRFGLWAELARNELSLPAIVNWLVLRPLRSSLALVTWIEHEIIVKRGRLGHELWLTRLLAAVEELRNESPRFYASALSLTIGTLLITWFYLTG